MKLLLLTLGLAMAEDDPEAAWGGGSTDEEPPPEEEEAPPAGGWSGGATPAPAPAPTPAPAPAPAPAPPPTPAPPPAVQADPPEGPPEGAPKGAPEGAPEGGESPDPASIIGAAVEAPPVDPEQLAWLKPKLGAMAPNPYAHTDFTAYTLEWGEFQVALSNLGVGVLPRTQIGTSVPLDVLGLYNVSGKVNPVRLGPWDLALNAAHFRLVQPEFHTGYTRLGVTNSFKVHEKLGLHLGLDWWTVHMEGVPDLEAIHPALRYDAETLGTVIGDPIDYSVRALSLRLASDIRFNRRDSLIVQLDSALWSQPMSESIPDLPPLEALNTLATADGFMSPLSVYSASLAYQVDLRRLSVRVGAGYSSTPGAWLLRSFELSYRFGGPTKIDERRQRNTWRRNRRESAQHP